MAKLGHLSSRSKMVGVASLVALPGFLFYAILFATAINVPLEDDYEALLDFLNSVVKPGTLSSRAAYFFSAMFNEYKLFFGHAVAWLQVAVVGHVDIRILCAIGNGFVLLLAILLWKMFLPRHEDMLQRMTLFTPAAWMLFQLQYVETLNWAMPSLATLPVIAFSFAAIYFLTRTDRLGYFLALICLSLAVASFANGFILVPLGLLILAVGRRYERAAGWLVVSAVCVIAYAYKYKLGVPGSPTAHHSPGARSLYVLAFIGNAAAGTLPGLNHRLVVSSSVCLGLLLCFFFGAAAKMGHTRKNPAAGYCVLFLILTALGVAGLRAELGIAHSLDSRYQIYGALFIIFAWFAIAERLSRNLVVPLRHNRAFVVSCLLAAFFSLNADISGLSYLRARNRKIIAGMRAYEQHEATGPILPYPNQGARFDELDSHAPQILKRSMGLGIYSPPTY